MTENQTSSTTALKDAEKLIAAKNYDDALGILRTYWLTNQNDLEAIRMLSRVYKARGNAELSGSLYKLSESADALTKDLEQLFDSGYKLIDERELQLAIMLLEQVADKTPHDMTVHYELGFALMSLHRFEDAIPYFEKVAAQDKDFDTLLNLCVCYMLVRDLEKAEKTFELLSPLAQSEEEKKELLIRRAAIKRAERFKNKKVLSPRDWTYILYGSILLSEPNIYEMTLAQQPEVISGLTKSTAGKSGSNNPDYKAIAWTLLILHKLLEELGYEFDVIEFYSPLSRPLAEALAHKLDLPARSFGGVNSPDRALLIIAWAPNIIGPHLTFVKNTTKRVIFAYGLSTVQPLPLTPDVVANLCSGCQMPWSETLEEDAVDQQIPGRMDLPDSVQAKATDLIVQQIAELESVPEIIQTVQELSDYYKPKVEQLVIGNPEHFPERPDYTAEIMF